MSRQELRGLIAECEQDRYAEYKSDWQGRAVACLNEIYFDSDRYDDEIFGLASDEWEQLVKQQLESRGWAGLLYFVGRLEPADDWGRLDGYGNAESVSGSDLLGLLKDELAEMERDE